LEVGGSCGPFNNNSLCCVGVHTGLCEFTGHKCPVRTRDLIIKYNDVNFVTQATGGPGTQRVRREERSVNRGDGVWAKFLGTSGKFKLGAAKGKPQTQTPQAPPL
jgi:hypothetical protein